MEHNSVLRPLHALQEQRGVEVTHVGADADTGVVDVGALLAAARPNTRLIAVNHGSNVTGAVQAIGAIGPESRRRGITFLVDAAQTAGHRVIDMQDACIDLLAMPGHKGLMGPLGTGVLCMRPGMEASIAPLLEGGTGSVSETPIQPMHLPDKYESGSHNAIGIAGLGAAVRWIEEKTVDALQAHDRELSARFLERVAGCAGLRVFGPTQPEARVAVFGMRLDGFDPAELAAVLDSAFGIQSRSGIQCAPLAHQTIGTLDQGGTTRVSFGAFNTVDDVERCAEAIVSLAGAAIG
jgi:selenocysteine lyase/cysteine desulfurase